MRNSLLPATISFILIAASALAGQAPAGAKKSGPSAPAVKKPEKKARQGTKWDLMDVGPFFSRA